jgi:hypothetical protein
VTLISVSFSPVAKAKPDDRAGNGYKEGLDDLRVPISKQIPGNNSDENADAFGNRECRAGSGHGIQTTIFQRRFPASMGQ